MENKELYEERHEGLKKDIDFHAKRIGEHCEKISELEQKIDAVCNSLNTLLKSIGRHSQR